MPSDLLPPTKGKGGFSLVELLLAIAVTAILLTLAWGASLEARRWSQEARCLTNLRTYGTALLATSTEGLFITPGYEQGNNKMLWNYVLNEKNLVSFDVQRTLYCPEVLSSDYLLSGKTEADWAKQGYLNSIGYGYNLWLGKKRPASIEQPSKTVLLMETYMGAPTIAGTMVRTRIAFRHRNANHIFYCDGHVEKWKQSVEMPKFTDPFWAYPPL